MSFAAPDWLFALVLVPGFWAWASMRARGRHGDGGGGARARWLWVDGSRVRPAPELGARRRFGAWASAGLALGVVALAQPQWGEGEVVRFDQGREVLIALDLSRSMHAQDVPPSRLDRARLLIESTLDQLRGERVGLLLFAGTAFLQSPLSADHEVLRELLPVLEPGYLPQGGTDFASMIDAALEAFSQTGAADRFLVILSDGESPNFSPSAVDALVEAGVRVVALGIGTEAGALIPDGRGGIVKDERGAAVLSRLERPVLEGLARGTHGVYADAAQWVDLASLVERTVAQGREGAFVEERERARIHRFQWWLAPALALLLASHLFEVPAAARSRRLHESRAARTGVGAAAEHAGAAAILSLIVLVLLTDAPLAWAAPGVTAQPGPVRVFDGEPPETPAGDPIVAVVERLATAPEVGALDYAELARITADEGAGRMSGSEPLPKGAIHDALAAVEAGRALDANAAAWDELRARLEMLDQTPPPQDGAPQSESGEGEPGDEQQGDQSGERSQSEDGEPGDEGESSSEGEPSPSDAASDSPAAGDENAAEDEGNPTPTDGQQSQGDPGEGDSEEGTGERERGDPHAMQQASAGFGDLDSEDQSGDDGTQRDADAEAGADEDAETPGQPPPSRMVGGTRSANEALLQERPDLAGVVGHMERVREGDAPALLFDRMNRAEGNASDQPQRGGQDW